MKKITLSMIVVAGLIFFSVCRKSYLDKRPIGQLDETSLANKRGVEGLLIGAYSLLDGVNGDAGPGIGWHSAASNWIYGSICGSEAYAGSPGDQGVDEIEQFKSTGYSAALATKWGIVYEGVQRANEVLRMLPKAKDISAVDQTRITAEARFLRGHYHFEAKKIWGKVPYIDETITYGNGNYDVTNENDIWPDIEKDLKYALENLDVVPYGDAVGRATKYTAMALLAKAYMFQRKFTEAEPLLEMIINAGPFSLKSYADNFNPATRNGNESIFSAQMSVNDRSGGYNGNYGDVLNFPHIDGGNTSCCGFFQPSQYLVNHFKTDSSGLPDLTNFNNSDVKNDEDTSSSDPFTPYTGCLDPRLDWTVGRR